MRIDDVNSSPQSQATQKTNAAGTPSAKHDRTAAGGSSDTAEVSNLARALSASDPQRIDRLRQAVQNGTYHVSSAKVASGIIDDVFKS